MRRIGFWIVLAGVAVWVVTQAPLFLYGRFGPEDGNPIGLGLLMAVGWPAATVLVGTGLLLVLLGWLLRGREGFRP